MTKILKYERTYLTHDSTLLHLLHLFDLLVELQSVGGCECVSSELVYSLLPSIVQLLVFLEPLQVHQFLHGGSLMAILLKHQLTRFLAGLALLFPR